MKKITISASIDKSSKGEKILKAAKNLLDLLEDTEEDFLEDNDLMDLYDELIETIPAFQMSIRTKR